MLRLWFPGLWIMDFPDFTDYVKSTRISGKYVSSNFKCITKKNCGFIRDQDRNITSLVATSFYNCLRTKAICFSKITAYLTFSYVIPYKISHVYLPGMRVRMTYPSHPLGTRNTPSCTSICILNLWYASSFQKFPGDHAPSAKLLAPLLLDPLLPPDINQWRI